MRFVDFEPLTENQPAGQNISQPAVVDLMATAVRMMTENLLPTAASAELATSVRDEFYGKSRTLNAFWKFCNTLPVMAQGMHVG